MMILYKDCADALFLNKTRALYSLETTVSGKDSGLGMFFDNRRYLLTYKKLTFA